MAHRILLVWGALCIMLLGRAQSPSFCQKVKHLDAALQNHHISPLSADTLTHRLHQLFYRKIDPVGLFLTEQQIESFPKLISAEAITNEQYCPELESVKRVFRQNLKRADSIVQARSARPFDLETSHKVKSPRTYRNDHARNNSALSARILNFYKHATLKQVINLQEPERVTSDIKEKEEKARQQIQKKFHCYINELLEDTSYYEDVFLQAWAGTHDPHSKYLSPRFMRLFRGSLATRKGSFGISVTKKQFGHVRIGKVIPGSPAWKTQQIHKGDRIVSIKPVDEEALDLNCKNSLAINRWLQSTSNEKIELTIRQNDEETKTFTLKRQVIENEQNVIKSFVLEGTNNVGYIRIPAFYTQWKTKSPKGSANDVAKELYNLKQEGINGLILDLRSNKGGSLHEAVHLAGIFVDRKPLGYFHTSEQTNHLMKDPEVGSAYKGPLIILVNGHSASASELLAASLQDLDRALIVGQTTHGKGTSQELKKLNPSRENSNSETEMGHTKVTKNIIYRIDGTSFQRTGVAPDLRLPYLKRMEHKREEQLPYALQAGTIQENAVNKSNGSSIPVADLRQKWRNRLNTSAIYQKLDSLNAILKDYRSQDKINLNPATFVKRKRTLGVTFRDLITSSSSDEQNAPFDVKTHSYDQDIFMMSDYEKQAHKKLKNNILFDIWVRETYRIMNDLIKSD